MIYNEDYGYIKMCILQRNWEKLFERIEYLRRFYRRRKIESIQNWEEYLGLLLKYLQTSAIWSTLFSIFEIFLFQIFFLFLFFYKLQAFVIKLTPLSSYNLHPSLIPIVLSLMSTINIFNWINNFPVYSLTL